MSQTVWRRSVQKQLYKESKGHKGGDGEKDASGRRGFAAYKEDGEWLLPPVPGERCLARQNADGSFEVEAFAPVTGTDAFAAECAVLQAMQDVACRGGAPHGVTLQAMFPMKAEESDVQTLVGRAQALCGLAGLRLEGFQAQVNPAAERLIVSATVRGRAKRLVRMQDAKAGQEIVLCGFAGLEGSLRIAGERREALEKRFVPAFLRQMDGLKIHLNQMDALRMLQAACESGSGRVLKNSCGEGDVCQASGVGGMDGGFMCHVSAMQQAASGGIFAALWELCEAAKTGLEIDLKKIQICQETVEICEYYQLNPYQMTSAGCILLLTNQAETLLDRLEQKGIRAARLGVTTPGTARVMINGEEQRYLERPAPDELMRFLQRELEQARSM